MYRPSRGVAIQKLKDLIGTWHIGNFIYCNYFIFKVPMTAAPGHSTLQVINTAGGS
jgi:hypothetical protein